MAACRLSMLQRPCGSLQVGCHASGVQQVMLHWCRLHIACLAEVRADLRVQCVAPSNSLSCTRLCCKVPPPQLFGLGRWINEQHA